MSGLVTSDAEDGGRCESSVSESLRLDFDAGAWSSSGNQTWREPRSLGAPGSLAKSPWSSEGGGGGRFRLRSLPSCLRWRFFLCWYSASNAAMSAGLAPWSRRR